MQQAHYLNALGVVQYRRRTLSVQPPAAQAKAEPAPLAAEAGVARQVMAAAEASSSARAAIAGADTRAAPAEKVATAAPRSAASASQSGTGCAFDLLIWQTDRLLVWEFSIDQEPLSASKHQLVNNVLKALWPRDFRGTEMLRQSWPLPGADASPTSAASWLTSMLSGRKRQSAATPVWCMGDPGVELLFDNAAELADSSAVTHPRLGMEFFIGPGLAELLENPIAKAQTWQLLRGLRSD